MSSVARPTPAQKTRRLIVLAATVFAVLAGQLQTLGGPGQTAAEFAAYGDTTLSVAGYAFAIWGPIYLGLIAYAVRQVLPGTGESDMITRFGWPSALAFLGIGLWSVAAAFDWKAATIVIITGSLTVLLIPMLTHARFIRILPPMDRDRWLVAWPLGTLAGWLTVATPLNLITVATGNGDLPPALSPTAWALIAVAAALLLGLFVSWRTRLLAYPLPIAWGLVGAFVAEQGRNPTLAYAAVVAAVVLVVGGVVLAFRITPGVERAGA